MEKVASSESAVAVETAVISPVFVTVSSPAPALIPSASVIAFEVASAFAAPSIETATDTSPLTPVATAVTAPLLVIVSLPVDATLS